MHHHQSTGRVPLAMRHEGRHHQVAEWRWQPQAKCALWSLRKTCVTLEYFSVDISVANRRRRRLAVGSRSC